jgi:hypothetical protein
MPDGAIHSASSGEGAVCSVHDRVRRPRRDITSEDGKHGPAKDSRIPSVINHVGTPSVPLAIFEHRPTAPKSRLVAVLGPATGPPKQAVYRDRTDRHGSGQRTALRGLDTFDTSS